MDYDWNPIVFGGGVLIGGNAHLTIHQDGTYSFSGHFHDSGATVYNMGLVWAVKDAKNIVYTFEHKGHVAGTFESGSRDDDWTVDGQNDDIAKAWADIVAGNVAVPKTTASADLINILNTALAVVGAILVVVGIVA